MVSPTDIFPRDLWKTILKDPTLSAEDLSRMSRVCKFFDPLITSPPLNSTWERCTKERFTKFEADYKYRMNVKWRTLFLNYATKEREKTDALNKFDQMNKGEGVFSNKERKQACFAVANILVDERRLLGSIPNEYKPKSEAVFYLLRFFKIMDCDPEVLCHLADSFTYGLDQPLTPAEAGQCLQMSADQGNAEAQVTLANLHKMGAITGAVDYPQAVKYYELSAEKEDVRALFELGACYENGLGIEKNLHKAFECYMKAAQKGEPVSQFSLGLFYHSGFGTEVDLNKAVEWYTKSADLGNAEAQFALGVCCERAAKTKADLLKAVNFYRISAEQGNAEAQYKLGNCYHLGRGTDINLEKAVEWFTKSGAQGNADAECSLGYCYLKGLGVTANSVTGFELMKLAADKGILYAQKWLVQLYQRGIGTAVDPVKADEYAKLAVENMSKQKKRKADEISKS